MHVHITKGVYIIAFECNKSYLISDKILTFLLHCYQFDFK